MKKVEIEKLIGTDHEVRVEAPNSTYGYPGFGQVIAVNMYQSKSHYRTSRQIGPPPIREAQYSQRGGVHVRVRRRMWDGKIKILDEVVPYSHIHIDTQADYDARKAAERKIQEDYRRQKAEAEQIRLERTKAVAARFAKLGVPVFDEHNGVVSIHIDNAEKILNRLEGGSP